MRLAPITLLTFLLVALSATPGRAFTDVELIDGFMRTVFGSEFPAWNGQAGIVKKYARTVRVFVDDRSKARRGAEVVVLEAHHVGAGASGRTGAIALEGTAAGPLDDASDCLGALARLVREADITCDLELGGCWELEHLPPAAAGAPLSAESYATATPRRGVMRT